MNIFVTGDLIADKDIARQESGPKRYRDDCTVTLEKTEKGGCLVYTISV